MGTYSSQYPAHGAVGWDSAVNGIFDSLDTRLTTDEVAVAAATTAAAAATTAAAAAVQTPSQLYFGTNQTAVVGKRYVGGTPSALTLTLPTAPADRSVVVVRNYYGATGIITVAAGGTAAWVGGGTTDTINLAGEEHTYTYQLSGNVWFISTTMPLAQLDARYAPLGASYKGIAYASNDKVYAGYDLAPNGLPIVASATMTAAQITLLYPTIGGTQVWHVILDHAGVFSTIATVTVADGARTGITNSLSVSLVAGDLLLVQCFQANGTTYSGLGPSFRAAFGGSLTTPTAPSAITSLTATPGTTTVGLSWTAGTNSASNLIRRDGVPYAITANAAFTDNGPTGAGLSPGESHTYNVDALVPGNITVNNSGVVSGPGNSYTYYPSTAQALSALTNDFTVTLGTNSGTSAAIDSSGILTMTSGAVGSDNKQDRVNYRWIKDSTVAGTAPGASHSAFTKQWLFGVGTSGIIVDHYWDAAAFAGFTTSTTNYIRMEFNVTGYQFTVKAASYNSGAAYTLTASTTSPAQATTVGDSTGVVHWPITVTPDNTKATLYGLKVDLKPILGDGTQQILVYMGTKAQLLGGTLPLINTITLTAVQRSALAAGEHYTTLIGSQSSAIAQLYYEQMLTIQPDI